MLLPRELHKTTSGFSPTCDLDDNAIGRLRFARPSGAWLTHDLEALSAAALHIRQSSMRTADRQHTFTAASAMLPAGGQHMTQVGMRQDDLADLRAAEQGNEQVAQRGRVAVISRDEIDC